jgi:hypothetical protein
MKFLFAVAAVGLSITAWAPDARAQGSGYGTVYPTPTCERGYKYDKKTRKCVRIPRGSN